MPKWLSITGAAVPWVVALMGVPIAPAVAGALSTGVAIGNSLPKRKRDDLASSWDEPRSCSTNSVVVRAAPSARPSGTWLVTG